MSNIVQQIKMIIWSTFNFALLIFFGIIHQSGIQPSICYLQSNIAPVQKTNFIFFHTYMPPRHLLCMPGMFRWLTTNWFYRREFSDRCTWFKWIGYRNINLWIITCSWFKFQYDLHFESRFQILRTQWCWADIDVDVRVNRSCETNQRRTFDERVWNSFINWRFTTLRVLFMEKLANTNAS